MAEDNGSRLTAVLTADPEFDIRSYALALFYSYLHELTNAVYIDGDKGVFREYLLLDIEWQESSRIVTA